jgi:acetyltransferase-like isoleucine patch superfamily enzyme
MLGLVQALASEEKALARKRARSAAIGLYRKTDYRACQLRGRLRSGIANRPAGLWIRHGVRIFGDVSLGDHTRISEHVRIEALPSGEIRIGRGTYLGKRTEIIAEDSVRIGDDTLVSWDVLIMDTDYHEIDGCEKHRPVSIGSGVWIGARASILKGVAIGDGAVIAAGAVVTSDVPPGYLAAGTPARPIRPVTWKP